VPGLDGFLELNVRTYVRVSDKPGVWFFSLDAASRAAVAAARLVYRLPYYHARMRAEARADRIEYSCVRTDDRAAAARFEAEYGPAGETSRAEPGSRLHWLTERYCLYATRGTDVYRAEVHHLPWPLQPGAADVRVNSMAASHGIRLPAAPPLLHFARRLDVLIWPPRRVAAAP
jgi:uncharacterized protein YqjF (DUF2071 family)